MGVGSVHRVDLPGIGFETVKLCRTHQCLAGPHMRKFSVAPYTNGHIQFMPLCTNDIYTKIEVFKYNRPSLLKLQSGIHF